MQRNQEDILQSIQAGTGDLQRWVLSAALNGSVSRGRCEDMASVATKIAELARKLIAA